MNTTKYYNVFTIPLFSTMTDPSPIFYYLILTYNLHLNSCEYIVITTKCHDIFSCARSWYDILLFYFILTHKKLTHASQYFHNISMYTLYLQCKFIL